MLRSLPLDQVAMPWKMLELLERQVLRALGLVAKALLFWILAFAWSVAFLLIVGGPVYAQTPVSDLNSAAVTGPFDETPGKRTYIAAHAPGGFSFATGLPQIVTHWTFWSDACAHLADFEVCLTLNDSVVVDVSDMGGIGAGNERLASRFDLSGYRGLWTVHAFQADERCREPADLGFLLVDEAINANWTIADLATNAAFGDRAESLDVGPDGAIDVPDESFEALDLSFFQPDS